MMMGFQASVFTLSLIIIVIGFFSPVVLTSPLTLRSILEPTCTGVLDCSFTCGPGGVTVCTLAGPCTFSNTPNGGKTFTCVYDTVPSLLCNGRCIVNCNKILDPNVVSCNFECSLCKVKGAYLDCGLSCN